MNKAHELALEALKDVEILFKEALPKFNWGASALDNNAIFLLNNVPHTVSKAIAALEQEQAEPMADFPDRFFVTSREGTHDVRLYLGCGEFANDEQRIAYCKKITAKLNAAPPSPTASTALVMEADLPPLPHAYLSTQIVSGPLKPVYTGEQMREYTLAVIRSLSTEPGKTS